MYSLAAGVDRDHANADMAAVEERLRLLTSGDENHEGLLRAAGDRLVRWVTEGRPRGVRDWQHVEESFEMLAQCEARARRHWRRNWRQHATLQAQYRQAWRHQLTKEGDIS